MAGNCPWCSASVTAAKWRGGCGGRTVISVARKRMGAKAGAGVLWTMIRSVGRSRGAGSASTPPAAIHLQINKTGATGCPCKRMCLVRCAARCA